MKNFKDTAYKLSPPTGRGTGFKSEEGNYTNGHVWRSNRGVVETIQGLVLASSYYYGKSKKQGSCLSIIKEGMQYHRFFEKEFTQKTLVTLAKKFAADVFSNESARLLAHDIELAEKAYSKGFLDGYHQEEVLNNPAAEAADGASQYTTFFQSKAGAEASASLAAHDAEAGAKAIEAAADYMMEYLGLPKDMPSVSTMALKEYAAMLRTKAGAA